MSQYPPVPEIMLLEESLEFYSRQYELERQLPVITSASSSQSSSESTTNSPPHQDGEAPRPASIFLLSAEQARGAELGVPFMLIHLDDRGNDRTKP